jgi:hypothetical protein
LILYTLGDHPVARPLPTHRTTQAQNKRTQTSMPWVGFETTIPAFERAKTVHALDLAATVIDRSGCIDPRILDLGTNWKWVVSFTLRPLYPRIGGWVGPRTGLDDVEKRKISPLPELRPRGRPAGSQSLYRLSYPGVYITRNMWAKLRNATEFLRYAYTSSVFPGLSYWLVQI